MPESEKQMEEKERIAVLHALIKKLNEAGKPCSLSRLHKAVYFLQEIHNVPFGYRFHLEMSGPHGSQMDIDLNFLAVSGTVEQDESSNGSSIVYKANEFPKTWERHFRPIPPEWDEKLEQILPLMGKEPVELKNLALATYLIRTSRAPPSGSLSERMTRLRSRIRPQEAEAAVKNAEKMVKG